MNRSAETIEGNRFPASFRNPKPADNSGFRGPKPSPYNYGSKFQGGTEIASKSTQSVCPCCGAGLENQQAHVDLNSNSFVFRGQSVPLSPTQAEILATLVRKAPNLVTHDALIAAVWGVGSEPEDARRNINVQLHKIRKRLHGLPISIASVLATGYRVVIA